MTIRLKEMRNRTGMTQQQVSDKTGIPLGTLRRWEQHKNEPDSESLILLADLYQVSMDEMLGSSFANTQQQLTQEEMVLLSLYNSTDERGKEVIMTVARSQNAK